MLMQAENQEVSSDLKQVAVVTDELKVMSTEPGCLEVSTDSDNCVSLEMKIEDIVGSLSGKKRKYPAGEFEVSPSEKRVCIKTVELVEHDHAYSIRSPRRLRKKVDDLIDQAESFKKRLQTSQKKTSRLKKKVSSLTSVVSELKKENLVSSDCASMLERPFSGVPKELMKRLVT